MSTLFLGKNGTGKTKHIKKHIAGLSGRVIILDFSNEFDEITDNVFFLDEVNLLESNLSYTEMKAINAGYLNDSRCLYRRSMDLIMETDAYRALKEEYGNTEDEAFKREVSHIRTSNLIENTLERLHISWNKVESDYAKALNDKIPKKRSKNHISLDQAVEKIVKHDVIRFQTKTMQLDHQRAVAFCLLTHLSHLVDEPFHLIGDDISSFFNNGNTKLFLEATKPAHIDFVCSFNKPSALPKAMFPLWEDVHFHKIDNNASMKELTQLFKWSPKDDIVSTIRNLKIGQSHLYQPTFASATL